MTSKWLANSWKWFKYISIATNVIYSITDLYWQKHNPHFWQENGARTASLVIGGIYTGIFVLTVFVNIGLAMRKGLYRTWNEKTDLEKVCVVIECSTAFLGLVLYIVGVHNLQALVEGVNVLIAVGWTLGCAGYIFSMVGSFIYSKRRVTVLPRRQGDDIEMM